MRILLAHNSTYYPGLGGGDVSNRLLMEALAARGHECVVVSRTALRAAGAHEELLAELARRDVMATVEEPGVVRFALNGVEVHSATDTPNLREYFVRQIGALQPDVIVASTDDPAQLLLNAALDSGVPVVYLARATIALPFGPDCAFPSEAKTETLRGAKGVVGVSRYVADYIRQWSGIEAAALPISLMGAGPFADLGRFGNEFVTMVNPCVVKGIDIFTAVVAALPDTTFAAVPTWGTSEVDLAKLRAQPNITILDAVDNIDRILERSRILLVPSIWAEARSRIVVEAMLRGVPVIASDTGGLPEAKMGVPYLVPVNPIQRYGGKVDAQMVPVAETPPQNLTPWIDAIVRLTSDEGHWGEIAAQSRAAAHRYVSGLSGEAFEAFLKDLPRHPVAPVRARPAGVLTEKQRLLALRLRDQWLTPPELDAGGTNLICFPYAGAGSTVFSGWRDKVPAWTVRYPPRAESVEAVVAGLLEHVAPKLHGRFAFFGHSMGGGIAFEFTRALRRGGLPMPTTLIVSAATAPQLRTKVMPDPSDEEILEVLARIHGPSVPEGTLRLLMARFAPDARLHRRYLYREEAPLDIPIVTYGGSDDITVPVARLEPWAAQTTKGFRLRIFPGGHMYIDDPGTGLFSALAEDLQDER